MYENDIEDCMRLTRACILVYTTDEMSYYLCENDIDDCMRLTLACILVHIHNEMSVINHIEDCMRLTGNCIHNPDEMYEEFEDTKGAMLMFV